MKPRTFVITFTTLVLLACAGIMDAKTVDDAEAGTKLVGTWVIPQEHYTKAVRGGETTFKSDGTFVSSADFNLNGNQTRIEVEGKWKVEKGVLIEEITKSSREQMVPKGLTTRDTLLDVTEKRYRYLTEKGQERYHLRKK